MLRNECGILSNDGTIFKSQIVDSYLCLNSSSTNYQYIFATGLSQNKTIDIYYATPTAVLKQTYDTNLSGQQITFPATLETSYKDFYYCGDGLECVTSFRAVNANGCYSDDLVCHMNQFPNLECLCLNQRETDFNIDISNCSFPRNLNTLYLCDRGITGDLTTVKNFESIECLCLSQAPFTGNLSSIGNDFKYLNLCNTSASLQICVNELVNNSTCLTDLIAWITPSMSLCANTLDFSNFKNYCVYGVYNNIKGNISGWTFNTGFTNFYSISYYFTGDITNWDISNTTASQFNFLNYNYNASIINGDISGWGLPSTLQRFCLYGINVSCVPENYSNTNLNYFGLYQVNNITNDINNIDFGDKIVSTTITYTSMCGNLETYTFPTGSTSISFSNSCFTGNLSGITIPSNTGSIVLCGNNLNGDLTDFNFPATVTNFNLGFNTGVTMNLSTSTFDTCNIQRFCIDCISGITGSFDNFTTGNALSLFRALYTPICPSINDFNLNNVKCFELFNNGICDDITPFLTGATGLCSFCVAQMPYLSGDTTGLDFTGARTFVAYSTALSGSMCHYNPYCLRINNTSISSDIVNDFNIGVQGNYILMDSANLCGHLSGLTFNFSCIYYFQIAVNPNICGANEFTDYIFNNRKTFSRPQVFLYYYSIGDTVTGSTESLGSLGTYGGSPTGMDLTEEQVNNLAVGTDYTGTGINVPWNGRNKVWWMKNACVSSSSTSKRYVTFYIGY